jgi:hypothetical protein
VTVAKDRHHLHSRAGPEHRYSPADGRLGYGFLRDAAQARGGQLHMEEKEKPPPGTVY